MISSKGWNQEMIYEFGIYKPFTWPAGIWPLETPKTFGHIRISFVIFMQIMMITNIFIEMSQFRETSIDVAVDYLILLGSATLALTKILLIRFHRKDLVENMIGAANDWMLVKKEEYQETMLHFAGLSRIVFFLQIGAGYFVAITMVIVPLLSPEIQPIAKNNTLINVGKLLPYGSPCTHVENSTFLCNVLFISQSIQLFTTLNGNIGSDVFLFGIAMHLCGQFDLLREDFSKFAVENEIIGKERKQMTVKVERHCVLLNLAQRVEDTLHFILLIQLFLNATDICLLGVQLTVSLSIGNYILVARTLVAFYILMLQLFLYSYMGETLSSKVEAIMSAVYFSNWYLLSPTIAKDLRFVMARADIPFYITAGKFYSMDMNCFKNILKATFSYFSVLRLMLTE